MNHGYRIYNLNRLKERARLRSMQRKMQHPSVMLCWLNLRRKEEVTHVSEKRKKRTKHCPIGGRQWINGFELDISPQRVHHTPHTNPFCVDAPISHVYRSRVVLPFQVTHCKTARIAVLRTQFTRVLTLRRSKLEPVK